jgi:hypothetical protein
VISYHLTHINYTFKSPPKFHDNDCTSHCRFPFAKATLSFRWKSILLHNTWNEFYRRRPYGLSTAPTQLQSTILRLSISLQGKNADDKIIPSNYSTRERWQKGRDLMNGSVDDVRIHVECLHFCPWKVQHTIKNRRPSQNIPIFHSSKLSWVKWESASDNVSLTSPKPPLRNKGQEERFMLCTQEIFWFFAKKLLSGVANTPTLSVYFETAVEGKLLFDNGNGGVRSERETFHWFSDVSPLTPKKVISFSLLFCVFRRLLSWKWIFRHLKPFSLSKLHHAHHPEWYQFRFSDRLRVSGESSSVPRVCLFSSRVLQSN